MSQIFFTFAVIRQYIGEHYTGRSQMRGSGSSSHLRSKGNTAEAVSCLPHALFSFGEFFVSFSLLSLSGHPIILLLGSFLSGRCGWAQTFSSISLAWGGWMDMEAWFYWGQGSHYPLLSCLLCLSGSIPWASVPSKGTISPMRLYFFNFFWFFFPFKTCFLIKSLIFFFQCSALNPLFNYIHFTTPQLL